MVASVGEQDQPTHVSAPCSFPRLQGLRQVGGLRDEALRGRRDRLFQLFLFDGLGLPREQKQFEPAEMFEFFEQRLRNSCKETPRDLAPRQAIQFAKKPEQMLAPRRGQRRTALLVSGLTGINPVRFLTRFK